MADSRQPADLNLRCRDIAAIGGVNLTGSKGSNSILERNAIQFERRLLARSSPDQDQ
jgi:hypothetical protein